MYSLLSLMIDYPITSHANISMYYKYIGITIGIYPQKSSQSIPIILPHYIPLIYPKTYPINISKSTDVFRRVKATGELPNFAGNA